MPIGISGFSQLTKASMIGGTPAAIKQDALGDVAEVGAGRVEELADRAEGLRLLRLRRQVIVVRLDAHLLQLGADLDVEVALLLVVTQVDEHLAQAEAERQRSR